jgi:thiol:disulfide interchange protein
MASRRSRGASVNDDRAHGSIHPPHAPRSNGAANPPRVPSSTAELVRFTLPPPEPSRASTMLETLQYLGLGLVGGLILNVMPCVLPVLTLKAFHLVDGHKHEASRRRVLGLGYMVGTTSFFLVFGAIIAALRAGLMNGHPTSFFWGAQFQSPIFLASLTALMFAFGLNALGVFEITLSSDGDHGDEETIAGSVANGWFAALMATPCSAPFLGGATAFALAKDTAAWQTLAIFAAIGVGLSLPYVLLTVIPAFARLIPRPGAWMETFKQLMGFTLIGAAIYFFRAFQGIVSPDSAASMLLFLLALSIALWAVQKFGSAIEERGRRWGVRLAAIAGVVLMAKYGVAIEKRIGLKPPVVASTDKLPPVVLDGHLVWTAFDSAALASEGKRLRPVFLDFTAEWCVNCKANEKAVLETDRVRGAFQKTSVLPMKADMTEENLELSKILEKLGRAGIPDYVIMYPDGSYDLLPPAITPDLVASRLEEASRKYPSEKFIVN